MHGGIPESDRRHFKRLHALLLERFCQRALDELAAAIAEQDSTAHDRYLRVFRLLEQRDKELARAFDDYRRSTAVMQLAVMRRMGLLSDEDLEVFSEPTRQVICFADDN